MLIDSTLREGEQASDAHIPAGVRRRLIAGLAASGGVAEFEVGPASREDLAEVCAEVRRLAPGARLAVWCRATEADIALALAVQPDVVACAVPVSDLHLERRLGKDRAWARTRPAALMAAVAGRAALSIGLEDATRADPAFVAEMAHLATAAGAARVRLADTVGIASPAQMAALVRAVLPAGLPVAVHCHDDFGCATANAIASLEAGASLADACVLGLGDRAGIARTEQLLGWLALRQGRSEIRIDGLPALCRVLAESCGRRLDSHAAVVGSDIFVCGSGIHQHGLMHDPATYEPYAPALVGRERRLSFGQGCGRHALAVGLGLGDQQTASLAVRVRQRARQRGRPLSLTEVRRLMER